MTQDKFLIVKKEPDKKFYQVRSYFLIKVKLHPLGNKPHVVKIIWCISGIELESYVILTTLRDFYEESTNQAYDKTVIYQVYKYIFILPKIIYWYIMLVSILKEKRSVFLKHVLFSGSIQVSSSPVVHNRLSLVY